MSNVEESIWDTSAGNDGVQDVLADKVELWRDRLLDLGNRNALINTRFSERSSTIEFDTPSTEEIWEKLAAESEAGADPMRFPWRRDLVPPPPDWQEYEDESDDADAAFEGSSNGTTSVTGVGANGDAGNIPTIRKRKRREWNPPLDECRLSRHLRSHDLLVEPGSQVHGQCGLADACFGIRDDDDHVRETTGNLSCWQTECNAGLLQWVQSCSLVGSASRVQARLGHRKLHRQIAAESDGMSFHWPLSNADPP